MLKDSILGGEVSSCSGSSECLLLLDSSNIFQLPDFKPIGSEECHVPEYPLVSWKGDSVTLDSHLLACGGNDDNVLEKSVKRCRFRFFLG